jgi:hypothetical protein
MPHRHYGVPIAKRRPTYSGPTRAAAWSGGAIVGAIIAVVIVLGFVVYEVSKIVAYSDNTVTSAPRTTGAPLKPPTTPRKQAFHVAVTRASNGTVRPLGC